MTIAVANVNQSTDVFQSLFDVTNQLATSMSTLVVTTFANTTGASTSGNAFVQGQFGATVLVTNTLQGGTVGNTGPITIASNTTFTGSLANFSSNTTLNGANNTINGASLTINANTTLNGTANLTNITVSGSSVFGGNASFNSNINANANFSANGTTTLNVVNVNGVVALANTTTINGTLNATNNAVFSKTVTMNATVAANNFAVAGNSSFAGATTANTLTIGGSLLPASNNISFGSANNRWSAYANTLDTLVITSQTNRIGSVGETISNVVVITAPNTPTAIISLPRSTYRSGLIQIQANTADPFYQSSSTSYIHNDTNVKDTTYAVVYSSNTLYTVDSAVNGANIDIRVTTTSSNTTVKLVANLIKV